MSEINSEGALSLVPVKRKKAAAKKAAATPPPVPPPVRKSPRKKKQVTPVSPEKKQVTATRKSPRRGATAQVTPRKKSPRKDNTTPAQATPSKDSATPAQATPEAAAATANAGAAFDTASTVIATAATTAVKKTTKKSKTVEIFDTEDEDDEVEEVSVPVQARLPRQICENKELVNKHVDFWLTHMPDLTDLPVIKHTDLLFWAKHKKDKTKPHRFLQGLKASWVNASIDFVISQNKWPVLFDDRHGHAVDLRNEFVLVFWVSYVRYMVSGTSLISPCATLTKTSL